MPQPRLWTKTADFTICQMRGGGSTWAEIARTLGLSRNTVIERGRRLRAEAPAREALPVVEEDLADDPNRDALPAGHRLTWSLLSNEPYPEGDFK